MAAYTQDLYVDGLVADVRISRGAVYTAAFTPPKQPLAVTPSTIALYRSAAGDTATDESGKHPGVMGALGAGDAQEPKIVAECP